MDWGILFNVVAIIVSVAMPVIGVLALFLIKDIKSAIIKLDSSVDHLNEKMATVIERVTNQDFRIVHLEQANREIEKQVNKIHSKVAVMNRDNLSQ